MGKDSAIDSLRTQHIHVVQLRILGGGECFGRPKHHMAGIVHHYVDTATIGNDPLDSPIDRLFLLHIEFDGA